MRKLFKTLLIAGALTLVATSASAMSPKPGQACIMWICWDKPNQWKPNYGGRADADTGTVTNETEVAMWGNPGGNIFDLNSWKEFYKKENWHVKELNTDYSDTQLAFGRSRGSTCSPDPYGRRSTYCNESEVEAPVEQELAQTEFGSCLLDDKPIVLEELVDCRSDACLGRKFYYGSFGKVGR